MRACCTGLRSCYCQLRIHRCLAQHFHATPVPLFPLQVARDTACQQRAASAACTQKRPPPHVIASRCHHCHHSQPPCLFTPTQVVLEAACQQRDASAARAAVAALSDAQRSELLAATVVYAERSAAAVAAARATAGQSPASPVHAAAAAAAAIGEETSMEAAQRVVLTAG